MAKTVNCPICTTRRQRVGRRPASELYYVGRALTPAKGHSRYVGLMGKIRLCEARERPRSLQTIERDEQETSSHA